VATNKFTKAEKELIWDSHQAGVPVMTEASFHD